ncbi:unnamed protein product [Calypogeia fissa]
MSVMVYSLGVQPRLVLRSFFRGANAGLPFRQGQSVCISSTRVHSKTARSLKVIASKVENRYEELESKTLVLAEDETRGGLKYEGVVEKGECKVRLDQWLARQLPHVSRARVQTSIRHGLALVNGLPASKVSFPVKGGDHVQCKLIGPAPSSAEPEDIALDIAYEDEHLLVINKPANMVVHPAPGHSGGTLVNALLHHCRLPSMRMATGSSAPKSLLGSEEEQFQEEDEDLLEDDDDEEAALQLVHEDLWSGPAPVIRPGIVHRLDKGTSGLLVVAKDDYTHEHLCNQFKARTVRRSYLAMTCGLPPLSIGRVDVPIGRDPRDRKRMAAFPFASSNARTRSAASKYRVLEILAGGGSALVEWRLETGRTHQIRVHAQHLGYPLIGDDMYGGTKGAAISKLLPRCPSGKHGILRHLVANIERPCLHAQTLGFTHPRTGDDHNFKCPPPDDFEEVLQALRQCGSKPVKS